MTTIIAINELTNQTEQLPMEQGGDVQQTLKDYGELRQTVYTLLGVEDASTKETK